MQNKPCSQKEPETWFLLTGKLTQAVTREQLPKAGMQDKQIEIQLSMATRKITSPGNGTPFIFRGEMK